MSKLRTVGILSFVAAVAVSASCKSDTKNLEDKIDNLTKMVDKLQKTGGGGGGAPGGGQRAARPEPDRSKTYAVPIDGAPVDGPSTAKITIVKGYEYACPFCEKVRPTMDEIKKKYGNDVRFAYKQFVVHPATATAPSLAVCAANMQGKFTQMDDAVWEKVFKTRAFDKDEGGTKCWDSPNGCPNLVAIANELQLDVPKFKADMKGACQASLQKDMADLQKLGVGATPAFFVNGRFLSGAQPLENFIALIDEELKKANDAIAKGTPAAEYYKQAVLTNGLKSLQ